jgi:hypothetical protein
MTADVYHVYCLLIYTWSSSESLRLPLHRRRPTISVPRTSLLHPDIYSRLPLRDPYSLANWDDRGMMFAAQEETPKGSPTKVG